MDTMTINPEKKEITERQVLDVHQAAKLLRVSADTVYDLLAARKLPGFKVGRSWRTTTTLVLDWLENSSTQHIGGTNSLDANMPPSRHHGIKHKVARKAASPKNE